MLIIAYFPMMKEVTINWYSFSYEVMTTCKLCVYKEMKRENCDYKVQNGQINVCSFSKIVIETDLLKQK